jgi:hypothetical protein
MRSQFLVQYRSHLPSCQDNHSVREPPPGPAAREPELGYCTALGDGCIRHVPVPVRVRSGKGIERLTPQWASAVIPKLAQIHHHIADSWTDDRGRLQF